MLQTAHKVLSLRRKVLVGKQQEHKQKLRQLHQQTIQYEKVVQQKRYEEALLARCQHQLSYNDNCLHYMCYQLRNQQSHPNSSTSSIRQLVTRTQSNQTKPTHPHPNTPTSSIRQIVAQSQPKQPKQTHHVNPSINWTTLKKQH